MFLYFPPVSCITKQKCPTAVIFQCKHRKSAEVPWHRNIKLFSYLIIFLSNISAAFCQLGKCVLGTFHISLQPIPENRNYHYCPFSWHPNSQWERSRFMQTERTRFSMKLYPTSNLSEEEGHHSSSPSVPSPKKTTFLPSSSSFPIALQCHWLNLLVTDWQRHKTQVKYQS